MTLHALPLIRRLVLWPLWLAALVAGCATPPVAEAPQAGTGIVGIQLALSGALSLFGSDVPDEVYFVQLDGDALIGENLIRSNFKADDRFYLLNAAPGRYAVVASGKSVPSPFPYGAPGRQTTYYASEAVEATRVELLPGRVAYMGRYAMQFAVGLSGGDPVQTHYRALINPTAPAAGVWKGVVQAMAGDTSFWGTVRTGARDAAARAEFLRQAAQDLAGRGWNAVLERAAP